MATAKLSIAQEFIDDYDERRGSAEFAGRSVKLAQPFVAFAQGLMAGDAATFKAGYTADNAFLATLDAFELTGAEQRHLARTIGADEKWVTA